MTGALLGATAPSASADTARLQVIEPTVPPSSARKEPLQPGETAPPGPPNTVRVTVTGADGRSRALATYADPGAPDGLLASPDGRWIAVLPEEDGDGEDPTTLVPTDGGPPVPLALPSDVSIARPYSQVSWTPDGSELVVGDAVRTTRRPGADPEQEQDGDETISFTALRCPVATRSCVEPPGPSGSAVGVPGGVLVSSSYLSVFPSELLLSSLDDTPGPETVLPTSRLGRVLRSLNDDVQVSVTHLETASPRTVGRFAGPASAGLPYTLGLVGGASGALALRYTTTTRIERRRGRIRLASTDTGPRLLTVAPDGSARTGPLPRLRVARRDLRTALPARRLRTAQRLPFVPALGRPDGGWIGFGSAMPEPFDVRGEALATMGDDGLPHVVRIGAHGATAERIVEAVPRLGRLDYVTQFDLVGYERATRSAVVHVRWGRELGRRSVRASEETFRVPLDGRSAPTVVAGGADTAW